MAQFTPTNSAATVYAPTSGGNPRGANMGAAQTLTDEMEKELQRLSGAVINAITFTLNAFTIPDAYKPWSVFDVSTLAADSTITLPAAANNIGNVLVLKRTVASGTYKATVLCAGSDTIDGWATGFPLLAQGDMVALFPKSGQWNAIAVRLSPYIEVVSATVSARTLFLGTTAIDFEVVGAGGQGGGIDGSGTASTSGAGGGGGSGAESRGRLDTRSLAAIGLVVGAAASGGSLAAAGNNNGTDGGDSEITWSSGANKVTSGGGKGGKGGAAATTATINLGGNGGTAATTGSTALVSGLVQRNGEQGGPGIMPGVAAQTVTGKGGSTSVGAGAPSTSTTGAGAAAQGYGGGGEGAKAGTASATDYQGGAGTSGCIRLIHHFLR